MIPLLQVASRQSGQSWTTAAVLRRPRARPGFAPMNSCTDSTSVSPGRSTCGRLESGPRHHPQTAGQRPLPAHARRRSRGAAGAVGAYAPRDERESQQRLCRQPALADGVGLRRQNVRLEHLLRSRRRAVSGWRSLSGTSLDNLPSSRIGKDRRNAPMPFRADTDRRSTVPGRCRFLGAAHLEKA